MTDDTLKKILGVIILIFGLKVANDWSRMIISLIWFVIMLCTLTILIFFIGKV